MALSCIISELKQDIGRKSRFFILGLHSMPPLRGPCSNISITFGTEKLKWWVHQICRKFENVFARLGTIHESDGRTDRQTPHDGIGRAINSVAQQKSTLKLFGG